MLDIFKIIFKIYELNYISNKTLNKNSQLKLDYNFDWKLQHKWDDSIEVKCQNDEILEVDFTSYLNTKNTILNQPLNSVNHFNNFNFYDLQNSEHFKNHVTNNLNQILYSSFNKFKPNRSDFSDSFSFFLKSDRLTNIIPNKKDSFMLHYITLHNFIENMSKSKIVIANRSSINKHPDYLNVINNTYLLVKKIYKRSVRHFNLYNFIYILISSLVLNDIIIFKNFVLKKMSGVRFKKHKRLLSMFRYAFRLATSFFFYRGAIKGFFFYLSGKIGIGGSVKRKVWKYSTGSVNLSCKKSKVKYQLFQVWTRTGCLGCKVGLSV